MTRPGQIVVILGEIHDYEDRRTWVVAAVEAGEGTGKSASGWVRKANDAVAMARNEHGGESDLVNGYRTRRVAFFGALDRRGIDVPPDTHHWCGDPYFRCVTTGSKLPEIARAK